MSRRRTYVNDMKAFAKVQRRIDREQRAAHARGEHSTAKVPACVVCNPEGNAL